MNPFYVLWILKIKKKRVEAQKLDSARLSQFDFELRLTKSSHKSEFSNHAYTPFNESKC